MKKFLLSISLIFIFIIYATQHKKEQKEIKFEQIPPNLSPTQTQTIGEKYKDGEYIGKITDAFYGKIQVKAIIKNGKLTDVKHLQYPNDRPTSTDINNAALPILTNEAIQAQSSQVDIVSGATDSSIAFKESLASALSQAL